MGLACSLENYATLRPFADYLDPNESLFSIFPWKRRILKQ